MITEQDIQQYVEDRDMTEHENRCFYGEGPSWWSELSPQQKRDHARRKLENEEEKEEGCSKCGCHEYEEHDGFPGETLYVCSQCGNIVSCSFDISAII